MGLTIGITTFSKRFGLLSKLINQIRAVNLTDNILICINGEQNGKFDNKYRKDILNLCLKYDNVYPIFFIEMRGLSKMWNTLIINSNEENVLLLNDDLEIYDNKIFENIKSHINSNQFNGFTRINQSFSHFLVNKKTIDNLGYFDERLLGFGEEDGDIYFRCLKNNVRIYDIYINGFNNLVSNIRHENVKSGIGKYSKFNRDYIYTQKYQTDFNSPYRGMFDTPMKELLENENQYPYENFFNKNKYNL
jgi:hypothetical protein